MLDFTPLNEHITLSYAVRQGGQEILRKRMRKALPAEMIQLPVKAAKLSENADVEVCVE